MTGGEPYPDERGRAYRRLGLAVRVIAIGGGVAMLAAATLVVTSVVLRWSGANPVAGDFEIVQMAMAPIVFAFLPICQWRRGNIAVATFTDRLPRRVLTWIDALWDVVYASVAAFLAFVLIIGAGDEKASGTATMVLATPIWPAILACAILAGFLAVVASATAGRLLATRR